MMKLFKFENVKFKNVLDIPELSIDQKKITILTGKSGGGKTTILKLMNKILSPCIGNILFNGGELQEQDSVEHRRQVVMLSQTPYIFKGTICDNLNAALRFHNKDDAEDNILTEMLQKMELPQNLSDDASKLSGGERQRLALGRILLLDPTAYLLDEPSSALDFDTEQFIIKMLTDHIRNTGKTAVVVTHSSSIAEEYSDKIIKVEKGRLL